MDVSLDFAMETYDRLITELHDIMDEEYPGMIPGQLPLFDDYGSPDQMVRILRGLADAMEAYYKASGDSSRL